jgi:hypothetical protein
MFPRNGESFFTFSLTIMQRRLYRHFQERMSHTLQFPEVSISERPLGPVHWTMAYQFEMR